jgi:alanine dehydrogenase
MDSKNTLLISKQDVVELLTIEECMDAVETAFRLYAEGSAAPPKILGLHVSNGGFHIKAGVMDLGREYFVAKTNANFPDNPKKTRLPTIQGVIVVFDASNGRLLAAMDSMEITIIRTGAATGVAAKYLAREDSKIATICGCGNQGKISLKAILNIRQLERIYVYDIDHSRAEKFSQELTTELGIAVSPVDELELAVGQSDIIVTCTPSKKPFLKKEYVKPGTFIAAVGADSEDKQELNSDLLTTSKLVTDLTDQCAAIGELHHALKLELMARSKVHAELGEIIAGKKLGRTSDREIIIFDSTGTALQDVAAAAIVYEKAIKKENALVFNFASEPAHHINH